MTASKKFKIKSYPGEGAIRRGATAAGALVSSAGTMAIWYGRLGIIAKIALPFGLVSPPTTILVAAGIVGGIAGRTYTKRQLLKRDRQWAKEHL